jgi:hypothetical protein
LGASVFFFLLFVGWELAENFVFYDRSAITILPVALAFLTLPRRIPIGDLGDGSGESADLAGRLEKLRSYCTWLRMIYVGATIGLVFILPRVIPAPT